MRLVFAVSALTAAACSTAPPEPGALIQDPYREYNRAVHDFNKGVDTAVLRPVAQAYDFATPMLVKHLLSNGLSHLRLPGVFINRVLQGDLEAASEVFGRFALNTIMGAGGLLDPATDFGIPYEGTDFGVTMAVWGVEEGIYHEAPFFGPSTTRHLFGRFVNFALDPSILITTGAVEVSGVVEALDLARTPVEVVNVRNDNAELIDSIFYESDDSYVTARSGYIQNRRRQISGEADTEALPDIFE